MSSSKNISHGV